MKLTTTFYLSAVGILLFISCTKEVDLNNPCENCIIVAPDTVQNQPAIPIAAIIGSQATVSLTSSENFPDTEFRLSIGSSGDLLSERIILDGQPLTWDFSSLSPGIYPVHIKQTNYVAGSSYPDFSFTITVPYGSVGPVVPLVTINDDVHEIDYSFILQVNQ